MSRIVPPWSDVSSRAGPAGGQPPTRTHEVVLALAVVMAVLLYLDRYALTVVTPEIMEDLSISKLQMGKAVSAFFFAYALAQVPAGWLADRLGPRLALMLYVSVWSLAVAGVAMSQTLAGLIAARGLLGLAQAGAYPTAVGLIKCWTPLAERGTASGAVSMGGRAGGVLSNLLTPYLMALVALGYVGSQGLWRPVLMAYGVLGLLWALLFGTWFRNTPREHRGVNAEELAEIERSPVGATAAAPIAGAERTPWLAMLGSLNVWLLCLVNFFINVGWIFLATWMTTYLREVHALSLEAAGWVTAGTGLAGMAGCFVGGRATDFLLRKLGLRWGRRTPALLGCGGAAAAYLVLHGGQHWLAVVIVCAVCASFFSDLVLGTVWATYQDIGGGSVGVALGFGNMCGNLGAWHFSDKIGRLAQGNDWSSVMLIAAGNFAAAMACWLLIDPRVPIVQRSA